MVSKDSTIELHPFICLLSGHLFMLQLKGVVLDLLWIRFVHLLYILLLFFWFGWCQKSNLMSHKSSQAKYSSTELQFQIQNLKWCFRQALHNTFILCVVFTGTQKSHFSYFEKGNVCSFWQWWKCGPPRFSDFSKDMIHGWDFLLSICNLLTHHSWRNKLIDSKCQQ